MERVKNEQVWRQIRTLFMGSIILFLVNIYFGFDNALTKGIIPRWQVLTHLHAGTLGWITLSIIGLAIWVYAGQREVSDSYVRSARNLSRFAIIAFGGYIVAFGLAFSQGSPFFYLMPVFGTASSLTIWAAAIFSIRQLRKQEVVTNLHLLIATALGVASLGSTMGVLLGLEYVIGSFVPGIDRIGVHAGVMDGYLFLAAAAIVEALVQKDPLQRRTRTGIILAVAWGGAGVMALIGLLLGIMPLVMSMTLFLLIGLAVFLVSMGRHALKYHPFGEGPRRWVFFGTLWVLFYGVFFIWLIASFAEDFSQAPAWVGTVLAHGAFVGMMTNLLIGVYSIRSQDAMDIMPWGETASMWLINLGLVAFLSLKIASDIRLGALVMGVGVLLGVALMFARLRASAPIREGKLERAEAHGAD